MRHYYTTQEVLQKGGPWLRATREYLLEHIPCEVKVIQDNDQLIISLTGWDLETLVACAVAADRNDRAPDHA